MNTAWLKQNWWKVLLIVAAIALAVTLFVLSSSITKKSQEQPIVTPAPTADGEATQNPVATITMESGEVIKVELYPSKAPNTVNNFIALANSGYYDGVILHRIIKGFVLQGGDPEGTGMGCPGYAIKGEFAKNGFEQNDIPHEPGVISMARSRMPDSAGSQFFLVVGDEPFVRQSLDNLYAGFGKTADQASLDVCMKLAEVKTGAGDRPVEPLVIKSIKVETFGVEYPEPEKISE